MTPLRVLKLSGSPYAMGFTHGSAFAADIATLTEERMRLCTDPFWTGGRSASLEEVRALGEACLRAHAEYSPALMAEMRGMADATGLGLNELVIMNGFTDFVDVVANPANGAHASVPPKSVESLLDDEGGCTTFIVGSSETRDGRPIIGQTWDMHTSATPHVLLLDIKPENGPALLTFTITGCVGMIGMNEEGVAVGINNLLGADGRAGVHWPYVVRQMLAQRSVEDALHALTSAPLSGAHNYVLMGPSRSGEFRGFNVEATATHAQVEPATGFLTHSNHCLSPAMQAVERPRKALSLESTCNRLDQSRAFLSARRGMIGIPEIMQMTRLHEAGQMSICAHALPEYDVESSGACIMSPATRQMWALWGLPCQNEYEEFLVGSSATAGVSLQ